MNDRRAGRRRLFKMLLAAAVAAGLLPAAAAAGGAPADLVYARPGRLVRAGDGARLNLHCMGHGAPAVIFDSGWEDWAPSWSIVQPQVARWTRTCSYDRAGTGWSAPGPMPRTSIRLATELHGALHRAGIGGRYILVGHAFGSDNVRTFAEFYMPEVAGVVLVEGDVMDLEPADLRDADHLGEIDNVAQLRACRALIASGRPLPLISSRPGRPARSCAQQFFRGIPEASWSPQLNASLLGIARTKVAMYDAFASEMEQMAADEAFLQRHQRPYGSRPLRVVTTGRHGVGSLAGQRPPSPEQRHYEEEAARAQARWLERSSDGSLITAANSSEYVQFDQPEFVVRAIREVYGAARAPGRTQDR